MSPATTKPFVRALLASLSLCGALLLLLFPAPVRSGTATLRFDPEALSGRIAQYLLGEAEIGSGTAPVGLQFGANLRLSDEHFTRRLISQTEPAIAVNPANGSNLVAGFHDLFPHTQDFVCRFTFTINGGTSWTLGGSTPLRTSGNFCSHSAIAADANGNFYFA